jgi:hypothetical protein
MTDIELAMFNSAVNVLAKLGNKYAAAKAIDVTIIHEGIRIRISRIGEDDDDTINGAAR